MDSSLFSKYENMKPSKSRRSPEGDMILMFMERLNMGREETGYSKITFGRMKKYLKGYDMYVLYMECERAKSFGKYFWWKLKNDKK
jgi:hypothetical protein